jgi:glycogen debranching enzyme
MDFLFDADFRDLFEVRGTKRIRRGRVNAEICGPDRVQFRYNGLDGIERRTVLSFSTIPVRLEANRAAFAIELGPDEQTSLFVNIACEEGPTNEPGDFIRAYRDSRRARRAATSATATVTSSNELFDEVMGRAASDVYTLITSTELGPYPYAGIPWFSTVFGRDGIITAMMMLWVDPSIARGVLRVLAHNQATEPDPKSDAQPGKILHEAP